MSQVVTPYLLGRAIDNGLRRRLVTVAELHEMYEELRRPGRRALANFRAALDDRPVDGYHPGDSDKELDLLSIIVEAGFPEPVAQYQVSVEGGLYLLDYAFPPWKIGAEYDGGDHATVSALHKDRRRFRKLQLAGWLILPFTKESMPVDIVRDLDDAFESRGFCRKPRSYPQTRQTTGRS